jgi:hypothetical protein
MDKVREILRTLKRIHFWILCGLIILAAPVIWFLASGRLVKDSATLKSDIESKYSTLTGIRAESPHPNETVEQKMDELIAGRVEEIREAWQKMFDQQKDVFVWPEVGNMRSLSQYLPIESKVPFPLTPEIVEKVPVSAVTMRETYAYYLLEELRRMAQEVGTEWTAVSADTGGIPSATTETRRDLLLEWEKSSQQEILEDHFSWNMRGGVAGALRPNVLDVLYAQEDLWVLRALMGIVQRTNEGATNAHNASVREILAIKIGQDAVTNEAELVSIAPVSEEAEEGSSEADRMETTAEVPEEGGEPSAVPVGPDPAEGRYVDKDYQPLPAQKLREVMTAASLSPEDAYLRVAKRIPIRMTVSIDQRAINRLLIECANSHPVVEIRQVRMPDREAKSTTTRTTFTPLGGDRTDGSQEADTPFPFDVTLEVYGIVYIYNSVPSQEEAKAVFGIGGEESEGGEEVSDDVSLDAAHDPNRQLASVARSATGGSR